MRTVRVLLCGWATFAFAQVITTSILDGTVTDSQGGVAVAAQIVVTLVLVGLLANRPRKWDDRLPSRDPVSST